MRAWPSGTRRERGAGPDRACGRGAARGQGRHQPAIVIRRASAPRRPAASSPAAATVPLPPTATAASSAGAALAATSACAIARETDLPRRGRHRGRGAERTCSSLEVCVILRPRPAAPGRSRRSAGPPAVLRLTEQWPRGRSRLAGRALGEKRAVLGERLGRPGGDALGAGEGARGPPASSETGLGRDRLPGGGHGRLRPRGRRSWSRPSPTTSRPRSAPIDLYEQLTPVHDRHGRVACHRARGQGPATPPTMPARSPSWRSRSGEELGLREDRRSTTCATAPSSTTSARSPSRMRSSTSRVRSATRSSS